MGVSHSRDDLRLVFAPILFAHKMLSFVAREGFYILMDHPHNFSFFDRRREPVLRLALFWIFGLVFGLLIFRSIGFDVDHIPLGNTNFFALLLCNVLPFLFSGICCYLGFPGLLFLICFGKAFSFGFVSCLIFAAYSPSGWLIRLLAMFSDLGSTVLLFLLWLRLLPGRSVLTPRQAAALFFTLLSIVCTDYLFISPLLQRLLFS